MSDYRKQVIVVRKDLGMRKGKMIAQGAHAAIEAAGNASATDRAKWKQTGQTKIVVGVEDVEKLSDIYKDAKDDGLPTSLIRDEGRTELEPGTKTAVAVGPAKPDEVDEHTGDLSLL